MPKRGAWVPYKRDKSGADLGAQSIVIYVCEKCGAWHERPNWWTKEQRQQPAHCINSLCGWIGFIRFDSKTEAKRWAALCRMQEGGRITELERQVRFPLLTVHHRTGQPVKWGEYICDFMYRDVATGEVVIEDRKPADRMSPEAALKLRVMQASGRTVTLS